MHFNIDTTISKRISIKAHLDVPSSSSDEKQYPLIVYLHGAGERDVDFEDLPKCSIRNKYNQKYAILTPHCPPNEIWEPDSIATLIKQCIDFGIVDYKRIYLTGFSMGARGVWATGTTYPHLFAGLVAVSGYSYYLKAAHLKHTPCLIFHSKTDECVSYDESVKMHCAIKENEGNSKMYSIPGGHKDATEIYYDEFIYNWMSQLVLDIRKQKIAR